MPKKNYVFDTNVLIHDPTSIFRFQDNDVYIPIYVLEEIDGLKNDPGERGRAAREATRILDDFRFRGSLTQGIKIHEEEESGYLRIYTPTERAELPVATGNKIDHCILQSALDIKKKNSDSRTILVTMDINLRVRAEAMDLQVAPYEFQSVDISNLGNKVITIDLTPNEFQDFYKTGEVELENQDIEINASVLLTCNGDLKKTALGRVKQNGCKVARKLRIPKHLFKITPRNMEQQFAVDLLLDDEVKLVTIMGKAGCGKTLLSLAAGLYQILEEGEKYSRMLVSRPVVPMGKDIGYLPGSIEEKLDPWMQPVYDNLDFLMMSGGAKKKYGKSYDDLFEEGLIEVEPLMYIRGRSIPNQFIIIDEAQNLTPHEVKTIITRCGVNTKIVFTGDVHQIDNPYISAKSNGLSVATKKLKDNPIVGTLELEKGERSPLANLAAEKM